MKTLKYLFIAALAIFSFNACEDVPAPYDIPAINGSSGSGSGSGSSEGVIFEQNFTSSLGSFTQFNNNPEVEWVNDYSSAVAKGYVNGQNLAAVSYLVSPAFDLTGKDAAHIALKYVICYANTTTVKANHQLLITDNYTGDATTTNWTELDYGAVSSSSFTFGDATVNIPQEFLGKSNIYIAFKYTSTTEKASTWEVKSVTVKDGEAPTKEEEETGEVMTVAQALAAYTGTAKPATVKGYIVGWVKGTNYEGGIQFNNDVIEEISSDGKQTNESTDIIIADSPDETDYNKCMPIQLPIGNIRNKVNLRDNPGNYKKMVTITGSLEKYFRVAGLKSVSKALFEGEEDGEGDNNETPAPLGNVYIDEKFADGLGSFTTAQIVNAYAWMHDSDYKYAKVSGYANGASQDAESWLISPTMNFANETAATISFDYVINKGDASLAAANHKLMITDSYTGDFYTTNWEEIDFGAQNDNTWNFRNTGNIAIPAAYMGKEAVVIAFKYLSTTSASSTWEVNNVLVTGEVGGTTDDNDNNTGEGEGEGNDTPAAGTIAAAIAAGPGNATVSGTVVATYARGFLVSDNTGSILVYLGEDKGYSAGDIVTVSGATTTYAGMLQFGNTSTVTKTGSESFTAPTAKQMSASEMDAYLNNPIIQYVSYTGKLVISGYYYNIEIAGAATAQGSLSYPNDGLVDASLDGKEVIVTGYTIGVSKSMYVNTMVTSVVAANGGDDNTDGDNTGGDDNTGDDDNTGGDDNTGDDNTGDDTTLPEGSISVADAISAYNNGTTGETTITAYIVGYAKSSGGSFVGEFSVGTAASNIIIADNPDETDSSKCMPVQLKSKTDIRAALNLVDNPGNLGKKITLTGSLEAYFSAPGLKELTAYSFE
ncbi:MAG: choice-of-anchor J domain-containing protein [Bacteroidaceae bacterium]|nr:choice-of-anchor J domain-containing protein [Bacteroidaceae bacterium]